MPPTPLPESPFPDELNDLIIRHAFRAAGPAPDTPLAAVTDEYFQNSWCEAQSGILSRTDALRVHPCDGPAPSEFRLELDRPFKSWSADGLELSPGPIRGRIFYRRDILSPSLPDDVPPVAVALDRDLHFYHPNVDRAGHVCLGDLPHDGACVALEPLLLYLITILTYENHRASDPLNFEAAELFALDPEEALRGLPSVEPLW